MTPIGPADSFAAEFVEDAAGTWPCHCDVEAHMMMVVYRVRR